MGPGRPVEGFSRLAGGRFLLLSCMNPVKFLAAAWRINVSDCTAWPARSNLASIPFQMKLRLVQTLVVTLVLWVAPGCTINRFVGSPGTFSGPETRFEFALIGDVPYDELQSRVYFPNMIEEINAADLAFVVHDGDIKSGSTPCTDELFERVHAQFQTIRHPLIYTFGDNEWTDCGRVQTNSFAPMERLQKLRDMFTRGDHSLGQRTMPLKRQSDDPTFAAYRENVRWTTGGVVFATLNVPGDRNHFGDPEFAERNAANLAWIRGAFALARNDEARAVMLIMQANPHFDLASTNALRRGFNEMLKVIEEETVAFRKPVVLVHGDSHYFRIDQPMMGSRSKRRIENFTRVETFGNPDVHWIQAIVDSRDPNVFQFERRLVKKNLLNHR